MGDTEQWTEQSSYEKSVTLWDYTPRRSKAYIGEDRQQIIYVRWLPFILISLGGACFFGYFGWRKI